MSYCHRTSPCGGASAWLVLGVILLAGCARAVAADVPTVSEPQATPPPITVTPATYCGVESILAAARLWGMPVDPAMLARDTYLSSPAGSTALDLVRAAGDLGMTVAAVRRMDAAGLGAVLSSGGLAILHVRQGITSATPDHWVLLTRLDRHGAAVVNNGQVEVWSRGGLGARWRGDAVVIGPPGLSLPGGGLGGMAGRLIAGRTGLWLAVVVATVLVAWGVRRWQLLRWRPAGWAGAGFDVAVLSAVTVVLAGVWTMAAPGQVLRDAEGRAFVNGVMRGALLPSLELAPGSAAPAGWMVIDSRSEREFARGHIPGAVHFDATYTRQDLRAFFGNVKQDQPMVVYCSNARCPLAEDLALRLIDEGFTTVRVFRGGWARWSGGGR